MDACYLGQQIFHRLYGLLLPSERCLYHGVNYHVQTDGPESIRFRYLSTASRIRAFQVFRTRPFPSLFVLTWLWSEMLGEGGGTTLTRAASHPETSSAKTKFLWFWLVQQKTSLPVTLKTKFLSICWYSVEPPSMCSLHFPSHSFFFLLHWLVQLLNGLTSTILSMTLQRQRLYIYMGHSKEKGTGRWTQHVLRLHRRRPGNLPLLVVSYLQYVHLRKWR